MIIFQCRVSEYFVLPPSGQRDIIAGDYTDLLHGCIQEIDHACAK